MTIQARQHMARIMCADGPWEACPRAGLQDGLWYPEPAPSWDWATYTYRVAQCAAYIATVDALNAWAGVRPVRRLFSDGTLSLAVHGPFTVTAGGFFLAESCKNTSRAQMGVWQPSQWVLDTGTVSRMPAAPRPYDQDSWPLTARYIRVAGNRDKRYSWKAVLSVSRSGIRTYSDFLSWERLAIGFDYTVDGVQWAPCARAPA